MNQLTPLAACLVIFIPLLCALATLGYLASTAKPRSQDRAPDDPQPIARFTQNGYTHEQWGKSNVKYIRRL